MGSYTKLLIHSDDTDGSTTFVDSSGEGHVITPHGNVHHETDQSKFGGSSIYFGGDDYITIPFSTDFQFLDKDWTVDLWVWQDSSQVSNERILLGFFDGPAAKRDWILMLHEKRPYILVLCDENNVEVLGSEVTSSTWHHIAAVCYLGVLSLYVDGTSVGSVNLPEQVQAYNREHLYIGVAHQEVSWFFKGYMDEIRITKGKALWTSNFTPPTAPCELKTISGVVKENGSPVARTVRSHIRDNGDVDGETTSNATTGEYTLTNQEDMEHYVVALDDDNEGVYNLSAADRVVGA